jgi:TonB family protein
MKRLLLFIFLFLLNGIILFGQVPVQQKDASIFTVVEQMPEFPGGAGEMMKYIQRNIHYPEKERDAGVEGKCFIKFVVEQDGSISNVEVLKGILNGQGCDQEALRVIKNMPNWTPGTQNGKLVRVYFNVPISFRLAPNGKTTNTISKPEYSNVQTETETAKEQTSTRTSYREVMEAAVKVKEPETKNEQTINKDSLNPAIEKYNKAIELNPNGTVAYYKRGVCKRKSGDYKGASEDYNKAIELNPKYDSAYNARGYLKYFLKDYEGAIEDYNKAIELSPKFIKAYINRGYAKHLLRDFNGAIEDYNKVIELDDKNDWAYKNRGDANIALKNYMGARFDFNKAIILNPKDAVAYNKRGLAESYSENDSIAISDYNKALELNPKLAIAYFNRGYSKSALKDYYGSIEDYTKAVELDSNGIYGYLNRGNSKRLLKDYAGAIKDYTKVIASNPIDIALVYCLRGVAKIALGDKNGACIDWAKADELGDDDARLKTNKYCK